jgi:hypothetical protein
MLEMMPERMQMSKNDPGVFVASSEIQRMKHAVAINHGIK